jgi:hypothetical protein
VPVPVGSGGSCWWIAVVIFGAVLLVGVGAWLWQRKKPTP